MQTGAATAFPGLIRIATVPATWERTGGNYRCTTNTLPHNWGFSFPPDPVTGTIYTLPALPPYFVPNNWQSVIYYAVGRNALENKGLAPTACVTCTNDPLLPPPPLLLGTLSIDDKAGNAVVLITTGSAGASRPSLLWSNYLDDALNSNADDRFVTPASKAFDRDRLWPIADLVPPVSCTSNARALLKNAPCHTTGNNVKPICASAAKSLKDPLCLPQPACGQAANDMVTPPCRNTLNPPQCQAAVKSLQGC